MSDTTEVIVGVIGRPHGVRGSVTVEPRTDEPELRFAPGSVLRVEGGARTLTVEGSRYSGPRLIVDFAEILDRNAAEEARGTVLMTDADVDERPADPDEFYDRHLIGLRVLAAAGVEAGVVVAVHHFPAQDLLLVRTASGERYVPLTSALVPTVDLDSGTCTVADVPGLLDDAAEDAR